MLHTRRRLWLSRFKAMAPAIISSASDNDPTTVASLAVIGSTTVYALGWLVLLVIPMLAVVQAIASQIGVVTKAGLEDLVRRRYGRVAALTMLAAVLAVNVLTLGADLEGGGAALQLLTGIAYGWWILPTAALGLVLLIVGRFRQVERVLVYLPLAFLAYIVAAFGAHPDWGAVLRDSLVPHFRLSGAFTSGAIALLGTTLTAYAYVWQQIEMSEEAPPVRRLGMVQINATVGAVLAGLTFWFIVIATGATLGVHHKAVQTAADAAAALEPIAGHGAAILFGIGLLGSALLAVPVLLATSAYVAAEMFGWVGKLDSHFFQARRFYATMIACAAISCAISLAHIAPIKLLFISSIAGGLATPITLVFMMLAATDKSIAGDHEIAPWLRYCGWATTAVVTAAAAVFLFQNFTGHT